MAKIGTYPAASALGGTEELIAVQSAASVKITPDQFKAYIASGAYKTGAYTAVAGDTVLVASDTGTITITLPATPTTNDKVSVWDAGDNAGSNVITVARNGSTINGLSDDFLINMDGGRADFVYDGTTWRYSFVIQTVQPSQTVTLVDRIRLSADGDLRVGNSLGPTPSTQTFELYQAECRVLGHSAAYQIAHGTVAFPPDWTGRVRARMVWAPSSTSTGVFQQSVRFYDYTDGTDTTSQDFSCDVLDAGLGVAADMQISDWTAWSTATNIDPEKLWTVTAQGAGSYTITGTAYLIHIELEIEREIPLKAASAISNTASMVSRTVTGTTDTILSTDNGKTLIYTNAAAVAVTLPDGLPADFQCTVMQYGAGTVTVTPATDTVNGAGAGVSPSAQYAALYLGKVDATGWVALS